MMPSLRNARRRAERRRGDDSGFMMIYVLMVVGIITTVVGATLTVTTATIVPSVQASYNQAADAAAQGGLQAFIAYVDANCGGATSSVAACSLPTNYSGTVAIPTPGAASSYSSSYSWLAVKDPSNRYFRVKSTGIVKQNGISSTKVVVGDIVGGSTLDLLDYGLVTGFESQSSATVLGDWPARTIALDCAAVDAADYPIKGDKCTSTTDTFLNSINWSGASPGTAAGKVAVCNATFDAKGGRGNNTPPKAPNPYVDWTEAGLNGNNYTNFQPCQTSWGSMTQLRTPIGNGADGAGGYFSNDALLISNSYPGGPGPLFNQPVATNWQYTSADAGICGLAPSQNYRSFNLQCAGYPIEVGGAPSTASKYPAVTVGQGPQLPTGNPVIPANACIYAGPTRVQINGNTAIVTSPQTTTAWIAANAPTNPAQCYTGATASGMALSSVDLTSITVLVANDNGSVPKTTPAIAHGSSGWPTTGQKLGATASTSNSLFYLTNAPAGGATTTYADGATDKPYTPATGDNPSSKTDGAWTPQWTSFSSGNNCNTNTATTDLKLFNCYINPAGYSATAYSTFKSTVQAALAANPQNYQTAAQLQTYLQSLLTPGNSADAASTAPTYTDNRSHRWKVSVATDASTTDGCTPTGGTPSTTNTAIPTPTADPFFANTPGNSAVTVQTATACLTASITLQIGTCNVALLAGICVNVGNYVWGNGTALLGGGLSVPQFKVTATPQATTTTTVITTATSTFPSMSDATQYQMGKSGTFGASGPGDLYIEGTAAHTMAVVAQDDVVVTGNLSGTVNAATNRSTSALQIIGQNNVHIYHPVQCRITNATEIATTDPGFCPDDITGLYNSIVPNGTRPDQQYVNMRSDLAGLTIRGVVMALGNAESHITCPQPPGGGGTCGGEFTVDNYSRGAPLSYLTEIGTLAMSHHAPVGQEWEVSDTTGQSSRPYSGYEMAQQYENLKALLAGVSVLPTQSPTSAMWHILSISTGSGS
ncbi:MAG TPA: hypothetical protein VGN18_04995 [Jatrophihabitans sp.]|jgi:hypothetical protein|uniref:hypothetical protein n=1 Tax=Jatrophihabitans sp. TaxID=1932789 RepID=UPI002DFC2836|nr:hypothetical protein [Jatrophihabitans sp.]